MDRRNFDKLKKYALLVEEELQNLRDINPKDTDKETKEAVLKRVNGLSEKTLKIISSVLEESENRILMLQEENERGENA
jgi:hypothetical protein